MEESEARAAARLAVGKAITEYARVWARERDLPDDDSLIITDPIVEGWAVTAAVTSTELAQADAEAHFTIMPNGQGRTLTLGLFWEQARDF